MKELTIEITNYCSLNCLHCSTKANTQGEIFFSVNQINNYLNQFPDFKKVRLSGGEPFEHPDLVEILKMTSGLKK